jgi:hypothetical protein
LLFINGWSTNKPVLKPIFSARANASSVVPAFRHFSLKFKNLISFSNFLLKGWSTDNAKNEAPKIVSGLVVKTFINSFNCLI